MIRLKQLSKIFQTSNQEVTAVDDVDLHIEAGEIFGVIGYSGAGKSTLVRLLNLLEAPTAGTVEVAGYDMQALDNSSLREARQEISMIFQHFNLLWSRTVYSNIALPLEIAGVPKSERKKRVEELIQLVGLAGREQAYPSQLSGGQKQRVGIARALANRPKVLLCDEATSALDPKTTDSILDLLVDINQKLGLTIVMITHEMHVIRKICHRVAVMEAGRVVEEGNVLQVFQQPEQEMTKEFVKQIAAPDEEAVQQVIESANAPVMKLTFTGTRAGEPVVSDWIREVQVDVNILHGKLTHTTEGSFGTLYVAVGANEDQLSHSLSFLNGRGVFTEVMA
ncbi:methionine ABC transporter ATP-binding protein [Salsuginibacillus kocurii]|uniref:methionine ABC transporter ATP-binding protein n=1 Tax=Salsuginibacillus kocurii TaxID=427078 RepID=UPI0003671876|nr:methionine ABC transporter ATP-binding protein [Salsuginibacillus kocurii]